MLKNISITTKLLFSFLCILICVLFIAYSSIKDIQKHDAIFHNSTVTTSQIQSLLEIKSDIYVINAAVTSLDSLSKKDATDMSLSLDKKIGIFANLDSLSKKINEYQKYADTADVKNSDFINAVTNEKSALVESSAQLLELISQGGPSDDVYLKKNELIGEVGNIKNMVDAQIDEEQSILRNLQESVKEDSNTSIENTILFSAFVVVLVLIIGLFIMKSIVRPLLIMYDAAIRRKNGDLSTRLSLDGKDEIGQLASAFNEITSKFQSSSTVLQEKVKENEDKSAALEGQIAETERTKRAVLNLLEDTRSAEEKADQERNMYLLLLSSIGEGVLVLDVDRKVTITNKIAERILEYKAPEIVGKRFDQLLSFVHADKTPLEGAFWDEAFSSPFSISPPNDISIIGKSGSLIPIFIIVAPIIDSHTQESKGVIITFRDVREERALEEARISFISTASHQLRTPLTSMRWFSEMLLGGDAGAISEEQKHFVERIYQGTDRMIALVNLLLQLARVEAGRVKVEPVPIDLKLTTEGVELTTKVNFDNKQQKVEIITDPIPFPVVLMDQDMVWQVIQNLLSNANRYSPVGSTIFVDIIQKGIEIEYSVKDSGIGIPKEQQGRLFEKFFRADNAIAAVPEGSGLGLALVKILVEGWGGRIWFETAEGKGTTFHFTVPLTGMKAKQGDVKLTV